MEEEVREYVQELDGIASVSELARFLELDEGCVRRFARYHGLRRIGSTYAFTEDAAADLARDLLGEDDDEYQDEEAVDLADGPD